MDIPAESIAPRWLTPDDCRLDEFISLVERPDSLADYPHAAAFESGVVVYDGAPVREALTASGGAGSLRAELAGALLDGPGIVVLRGAFDPPVLDRASEVFEAIIDQERATAGARGDHFAAPGANDRVWNALEKLALRDPEAFADYYANDFVALAAEAWLGPGYQVTSQVNVVNPGGQAQQPHRDYHLGFMTDEAAARYPTHVHRVSPLLTLQGAIAHRDMPVDTGPTMYLPHSHKYAPGYLAWRRPEFVDYFARHHVQLPLAKGDAVFFNPALFHAAGANRTAAVRRLANLLQISSPFGRAMEAVDRRAMVLAVYPALLRRKAGGAGDDELARVIAAVAEAYPFPADLDREQPVDGLAPESQAGTVRRALREGWDADTLASRIAG